MLWSITERNQHKCDRKESKKITAPENMRSGNLNGGAKGARTPGLLDAIQALSQLSYNPIPHIILQRSDLWK